jgi:hypothetical protein
MKQERTPKYTTIIHSVRIDLNLSCNEYCVADIIFSLSNNPDSKIHGWCWATKKTIGEFLGIGESGIKQIIKRLITKGMVEKDEETRYLKTTSLWYNSVVLERLKMKNIRQGTKYPEGVQSTLRGHKVPSQRAQSTLQHRAQSTYNNNKINKHNNNNILNTKVFNSNLNDLIDKFKSVNPSFKKLFSNKTQRSALERLLNIYTAQEIEKMLNMLPTTNKMAYFPTITTPSQLEDKLGSLLAAIAKHKSTVKEFVI